jgi:hypothetical protein
MATLPCIRNKSMGRPPKHTISKGQRFGRLVVSDPDARLAPTRGAPYGTRAAVCLCDCGTVTGPIRYGSLIRGDTTSCGCLMREQLREQAPARFAAHLRSEANLTHLAELHRRQTTHGLARHPLYKTHCGMMARCYQTDHRAYPSYGGRGIRVYEPWHDVRVFIAWAEENLGPRPEGCSLDRKDNDGNYEPGNVRWADPPTQQSNRRKVTALQDRIALLQRELDLLKGGEA